MFFNFGKMVDHLVIILQTTWSSKTQSLYYSAVETFGTVLSSSTNIISLSFFALCWQNFFCSLPVSIYPACRARPCPFSFNMNNSLLSTLMVQSSIKDVWHPLSLVGSFLHLSVVKFWPNFDNSHPLLIADVFYERSLSLETLLHVKSLCVRRDSKIQNSLSNPVNSIPYIFSNHQYRKNDFFLEKTLESRAFNNLVHWLNTNSCKKITSHKKFNYYSSTFHGRLLQLLNIVPGHDFLSSIVHQNCLE